MAWLARAGRNLATIFFAVRACIQMDMGDNMSFTHADRQICDCAKFAIQS